MWYKILKEDLIHNKFQYKIGLNIDTLLFNPSGSCKSGGLYYTNLHNLARFLHYGCYIADVEIPDDARVYEDPQGNKWKADRLIILSITKFIDHPLFNNANWCLMTIKYNVEFMRYVKNQTKDICLNAIQQDGYILRYIRNQTDEICLTAVQQKGLALKFVKEQTYEICLAAVKQNGLALKFVKKQTKAICFAAIQQNSFASRFLMTYSILN
jgi:hypothetical protein